MPEDKDRNDIEIIPPDGTSRQQRDAEWIYVSFDGNRTSFSNLPLHKRILLGVTWLAGLLIFGFVIFLIVASAVLIWIPLLLAIGLITAGYIFFRTRFTRR